MTQKTSFSRVLLSRKHQQFFRNLSWTLKAELVYGPENYDLQGLAWQKRSCPTYHSSVSPLPRVVEGTPGSPTNGSRRSDRPSCTRPSGPRSCHIRSDTSSSSPLPSSDNMVGASLNLRRSPKGMWSWSLAAAWSCCWGNDWKEGFVYLYSRLVNSVQKKNGSSNRSTIILIILLVWHFLVISFHWLVCSS